MQPHPHEKGTAFLLLTVLNETLVSPPEPDTLRVALETYPRAWRNWQTRQLEVLVGEIPWRFESSRAHNQQFKAIRMKQRQAQKQAWRCFFLKRAMAGTDDNAIVDGDFVVQEGELQAILKSLRGSGINIVAIHHHMIEETPKMIFLHYYYYWGKGEATGLAKAVRAALDLTKK